MRRLSITLNAELHGIPPADENVLEAIEDLLGVTNSTLLNPHVSVTVNLSPDMPVLPVSEGPADCPLSNCFQPMPHTHGTDVSTQSQFRDPAKAVSGKNTPTHDGNR